MANADWYPDPTRLHEHRYWNGTAWTAHVADRGEAATAPLDAAATFPPPAASIPDQPAPQGTAGAIDGHGSSGVKWLIGGLVVGLAVVVILVAVAVRGGGGGDGGGSSSAGGTWKSVKMSAFDAGLIEAGSDLNTTVQADAQTYASDPESWCQSGGTVDVGDQQALARWKAAAVHWPADLKVPRERAADAFMDAFAACARGDADTPAKFVEAGNLYQAVGEAFTAHCTVDPDDLMAVLCT